MRPRSIAPSHLRHAGDRRWRYSQQLRQIASTVPARECLSHQSPSSGAKRPCSAQSKERRYIHVSLHRSLSRQLMNIWWFLKSALTAFWPERVRCMAVGKRARLGSIFFEILPHEILERLNWIGAEHGKRPASFNQALFLSKVLPEAGPGPILGRFGKARLDRIGMDIAQQPAEIFIVVAGEGLEPILEDVPSPSSRDIEAFGPGRLHAVHDMRERIISDLEEQVKMIRHQAIGVEDEVGGLSNLRDHGEKLRPVVRGADDGLAAVAASHDVVQARGDMGSWRSGHTFIYDSERKRFPEILIHSMSGADTQSNDFSRLSLDENHLLHGVIAKTRYWV